VSDETTVPEGGTPPKQYYTVDQCTTCGTEVHGLHHVWACPNCGTCSPSAPPPGGWPPGEITPEERRTGTVGYDRP
jgi:hypothetical protein